MNLKVFMVGGLDYCKVVPSQVMSWFLKPQYRYSDFDGFWYIVHSPHPTPAKVGGHLILFFVVLVCFVRGEMGQPRFGVDSHDHHSQQFQHLGALGEGVLWKLSWKTDRFQGRVIGHGFWVNDWKIEGVGHGFLVNDGKWLDHWNGDYFKVNFKNDDVNPLDFGYFTFGQSRQICRSHGAWNISV